MNSRNSITQKLQEKIETDLGQEDYNTYRAVFMSFIRGEIDYSTYQQKIIEVLGIRLLPFHQRFVNLLRKRVIENKSTSRYKSILLRIKDEKKEAQVTQERIPKEQNLGNMNALVKTSSNAGNDLKQNYPPLCNQCRKTECICRYGEIRGGKSRQFREQAELRIDQNQPLDQGIVQFDKTGKYFNVEKIDQKPQIFLSEKECNPATEMRRDIHPAFRKLVEPRANSIGTNSFKRQRTKSPECDLDMNNEEKFEQQEGDIESLASRQKEMMFNYEIEVEAPFKIIAAERK